MAQQKNLTGMMADSSCGPIEDPSLDDTSAHSQATATSGKAGNMQSASTTPEGAKEDAHDAQRATSPDGTTGADTDATHTDTARTDKQPKPGPKCADCGAAAGLRCSGCVDGLDCHGNSVQTWYCSKECQRMHWRSSHKAGCKNAKTRTSLFRACTLLQSIYLATMRSMWKDKIAQVERQVENGLDKLLVYTEEDIDHKQYHDLSDSFGLTDDEKNAIVTHTNRKLATELMGAALEKHMQGCNVVAVQLDTGSTTQRAVRIFQNGEEMAVDPTHWVLFVKLAEGDGENYTVDFSNAQFLNFKAEARKHGILPCLDLLQNLPAAATEPLTAKMAEECGADPVNSFAQLYNTAGPESVASTRTRLGTLALAAFVITVNASQKEQAIKEGLMFHEMLRLPTERYNKTRDKIMQAAQRELNKVRDLLVRREYIEVMREMWKMQDILSPGVHGVHSFGNGS